MVVGVFALGVVGISVASFLVDREALIALIGVNHAYLILFIVSAATGVSTLTAAGFYAFFISFIQSQVDPVIAAVVAGVGVSFGDILIFVLARLVTKSSRRIEKSSTYRKICRFVEKLPEWGVYVFVFSTVRLYQSQTMCSWPCWEYCAIKLYRS